jgi:hypothetical protein
MSHELEKKNGQIKNGYQYYKPWCRGDLVFHRDLYQPRRTGRTISNPNSDQGQTRFHPVNWWLPTSLHIACHFGFNYIR